MIKCEFNDILKYGDFPLHIGKAHLKSDFHIHTHDFSELVVILEGKAVQVIDDFECPIEKGDIFILNGDTSHGFKKVENLILYNVMFNGEKAFAGYDYIKQLPGFQVLFVLEPFYRRERQFKSMLHLDYRELDMVETLIKKMLSEYKSGKEAFKQVIYMYFTALATFLAREYSASTNTEAESLFNIAHAVLHMDKNYTQKITLEDLAAIACLSPRHFGRVFKKNYNVSPMEYIIQLRLQHALKLMNSDRLTLTQVALESGFNDSNYFCRLFKAKYGVTPGAYKKIHN